MNTEKAGPRTILPKRFAGYTMDELTEYAEHMELASTAVVLFSPQTRRIFAREAEAARAMLARKIA